MTSIAMMDDSPQPQRTMSTNGDAEDEIDCNVIVMSESGKPIYSRFGSEEEIARTCGLVSAIRMSLLEPRMGLGDIQCLTSGCLKLVFMTVQSITLLAVSRFEWYGEAETEAYLHCQLEYVYGLILLTLTEHVQSVFLHNPNFDLRESLGATENLITNILDEASPKNASCGLFLTSAVETVFPLSEALRENASQELFKAGEKIDNTVFALLVVGKKLLTIVQPKHAHHQLSSFDLHLLIDFVHGRPGLLTSELWFPVCLPRFNSSGFLHVYTNCLDSNTKLTLILLSQENTTEQFQLFRGAASRIREGLRLPAVVGNVIRILDATEKGSEANGCDDIAWRRSLDVDGSHDRDEEDYVYVDESVAGTSTDHGQPSVCGLLCELDLALDAEKMATMIESYCEIAQAMHFVFRLDAPVQTDQAQAGKLSQCLSSPLDFPFVDDASKRRVFAMYQKLHLRLRLGSATSESTMDAFAAITYAEAASEDAKGICRHCPASLLSERAPLVQGITYQIESLELFLALNGREFELYMVVPNTIPVKQAATYGARLVRKLQLEKNKLFLGSPLVWKD